jgi:dipeptidase E
MAKTVFALGGGTLGEHRDTFKKWSLPMPAGQEYYKINTTPIDKMILRATGKRRPQVLLILTASEDGAHNLELLEQAFRAQFEERLGARLETLRLVTEQPPPSEIKRKIAGAEAIYASGGSTYLMMKTWRRLGVDKLLRQAYDSGTVMSGMSAGSICWFKYGNSNSFYSDKPFRVRGMAWFNLLICPHYDTEPFRQAAMKNMMKRTPQTMGIALDEHAALEIVDDTYRIHPFKPGAKAQKCYWANGEYVMRRLKPLSSYSPLQDLLGDLI